MKSIKLIAIITAAALTIGVAMTMYGLFRLHWPGIIPWEAGGRRRFVIFTLIAFAFVSLLSVRLRLNAFAVAALGALGLAGLAGGLWPLLMVIWFAIAATLLGEWCLRRMRFGVDDSALQFLAGAGLYGTACGLVAHLPINYPALYGAALALPLVLRRHRLQQWLAALLQPALRHVRPIDRTSRWLDIAIAVIGLVYFVVAFLPENGFDALAMHLFIASHLATNHRWEFDAATYVWAVMPMLADWLFSIGYMLAGETASRLINVGFIFLLAWLVRQLVVWAGGSRVGARWAVLLFLTSPLTFTEGSSLFIESVWAALAVGGTLAILRACSAEKDMRAHLGAAGLLLGFALAAKAVTFTILPALVPILLWRYKAWCKRGVVPVLMLGLLLFCVVAAIPYVTAWKLTGNPVFPFFNGIFKSPLWPSVNFESASVFGKGVRPDVLYGMTFNSGRYLEATTGVAGFQWLWLFFPAAVALLLTRHTRGIALLAVGVGSVFLTFQSVSYLRYIFPAWAMLTAMIAVGMSARATPLLVTSKVWSAIAICTILLNLAFFTAGAFYRDFPLSSIISASHRTQYLSERNPLRNAVTIVNALNTGKTPVAVFAPPLTAGLEADALYANWYNVGWQTAYNAAITEQDLAALFIDRRVTYLVVDSGSALSAAQFALLDKVSIPISQVGPLAIRRINDDYRFKKELLINPDFAHIDGWSLAAGAVFDDQRNMVVASVSAPVVQAVTVTAGSSYMVSVVARCHNGSAQGRVQVNWNDQAGIFLGTNIDVFDCTQDWQTHTMQVTAPPGAAAGAVYATSHTAIPLEFKSVHFKK
jgi:hypothetical protein